MQNNMCRIKAYKIHLIEQLDWNIWLKIPAGSHQNRNSTSGAVMSISKPISPSIWTINILTLRTHSIGSPDSAAWAHSPDILALMWRRKAGKWKRRLDCVKTFTTALRVAFHIGSEVLRVNMLGRLSVIMSKELYLHQHQQTFIYLHLCQVFQNVWHMSSVLKECSAHFTPGLKLELTPTECELDTENSSSQLKSVEIKLNSVWSATVLISTSASFLAEISVRSP